MYDYRNRARPKSIPDAERDRIAENLKNTLAAAEAFKARENSTRELQTMNTIHLSLDSLMAQGLKNITGENSFLLWNLVFGQYLTRIAGLIK